MFVGVSPVPAFEGAAVFGVVIEFSHTVLKDVSDLTLLQERQGQLILSVHKCLTDTKTSHIQSHISGIKNHNSHALSEELSCGDHLCFFTVRILQPAVRVRNFTAMIVVHLITHIHMHHMSSEVTIATGSHHSTGGS